MKNWFGKTCYRCWVLSLQYSCLTTTYQLSWWIRVNRINLNRFSLNWFFWYFYLLFRVFSLFSFWFKIVHAFTFVVEFLVKGEKSLKLFLCYFANFRMAMLLCWFTKPKFSISSGNINKIFKWWIMFSHSSYQAVLLIQICFYLCGHILCFCKEVIEIVGYYFEPTLHQYWIILCPRLFFWILISALFYT